MVLKGVTGRVAITAMMTACALGATGASAHAESPPASGPSLRVDSNDGRASLFRVDPDIWVVSAGSGHSPGPGTVEHWRRVCDAPCNAAVERSGLFRIAGAGLTTSETFSLHKDVTSLRVNAGSSGLRTAGLLGAFVGGSLTLTGLGLLTAHYANDSPAVPPGWPADVPAPQPPGSDVVTAGWGFLLTGAALIVAGTVTALANSTTIEPSSGP